MMRGLLIFLALCTFTAAMVPRDRRAANTNEEQTTTIENKKICAPQTPCAWTFYHPVTKLSTQNLINDYCECATGMHCTIVENDSSASAYVHRCRLPGEEEVTTYDS